MNGDAVLVAHLVELVDADDSAVSENHRASLKVELALFVPSISPRSSEEKEERTVVGSRWTEAVNPAAEDPLPEV